MRYFFFAVGIVLSFWSCVGSNEYMFDDMSYSSILQFESNGWTVRTKPGLPGTTGAEWKKENVSFHRDLESDDNTVLRMTASIGPSVRQTQICHERKYMEGTYAARVRLASAVSALPKWIILVQSFYTITPYEKPLDPAYSEMDFEYLPFGGRNIPPGRFATTTWDTVSIGPWKAHNAVDNFRRDLGGWHIFLIQVDGKHVKYFIDGEHLSTHSKPYYPDSLMSINFNIWFKETERDTIGDTFRFIEEIDWVFHSRNTVLSHAEAVAAVDSLRAANVAFTDLVPDAIPKLDCPCDL